MDKHTFFIVSLGCPKNSVDSDSIGILLKNAGYTPVKKPNQASVLIVNTCGFIHDARKESINEMKSLARKKKDGQLLIAAGCLTQLWGKKVRQEVPEVDAILGTRRWMDILYVIETLRSKPPQIFYHLPDSPGVGRDEPNILRASIHASSAYLKIADGCRRPCAFCAIPLIKGNLVSRQLDNIIDDAIQLEQKGVKEIILIAQDTTDYGHDLGMKDGLPKLLQELLSSTEIPWIRIMYAYPGYISDELINMMTSDSRILPYLDLPLQHSHPDTLRRMQRPANIEWVYKTLEKLRTALPQLALRSTFIVGYPGETEQEFTHLLSFLREIQFDRAGAFTYSPEVGTTSYQLGDPIPAEIKQARYDQLMSVQTEISHKINQSYIGQTLEVLVEGMDKGIIVGRSYRDAPEVDGYVVFEGDANLGEIVSVKITNAIPFDLIGIKE